MKNNVKLSRTIFGILALLFVVGVAFGLYFISILQSQEPEQVFSPDESKVIIPTVSSKKGNNDSYLLVHLEIQDAHSGNILFKVQTRASDRMRWSVGWIDNNTVELDSSDIGSYCWAEGDNQSWIEIQCP